MRGSPKLLVLLALFASCGGNTSAGDDAGGGLSFVDVSERAGIDVVNVSGDPRRWYIPESNGTGAAWLDYDGDGDLDLFVGNGAGMRYHDDGSRLEVVHSASSRLYRNDGNLRFTDVTAESGAGCSAWINAVTVADVEGDGDPDIYLACFGRDVLLRNENGRFVDATAEAGLGCELWGAGADFADVDRDGDLDLYVANYVLFDPEAPPHGGKRAVVEGVEIGWGPEGESGEGINPAAPNVFYRQETPGRFVEATDEAGLALPRPWCSYAAVFQDVTGNGWPDLLVANDLQPTNLFVNRGDGTFEEEGAKRGFAADATGNHTAAMGLMVADVDGDGDPDVLRTNFDMEANCLHVNDGSGSFRDLAGPVGLGNPSMDRLGWGGGFFDADLDGDLDLLVANGHVLPQAERIGMHPWAQRSQLFQAVPGGPLGVRWRDATADAGPGLAPLRSARGVALGDPDDDGDVDALIVDIDSPPRLLENESRRRGHWVGVRLRGAGGNTDAVGAKVTVHAGDRTWTRWMRRSEGLYSSRDPRLHFGLGTARAIDRIEVIWPRGARTVLRSPSPDSYLTITEPGPESR